MHYMRSESVHIQQEMDLKSSDEQRDRLLKVEREIHALCVVGAAVVQRTVR